MGWRCSQLYIYKLIHTLLLHKFYKIQNEKIIQKSRITNKCVVSLLQSGGSYHDFNYIETPFM